MPSLLHVSASPRGTASESLAIARTFLDALRDERPEVTIDTFDLWDGSLPEFGAASAATKMAVFAGQAPSGDQAAAWQAAERTFRRLAGADYYLFSVPMWNHGIPYILKQFIDVVSQPGMVFAFDAEHGYTGLLTGKRAVVVYTSAVYGTGRPATCTTAAALSSLSRNDGSTSCARYSKNLTASNSKRAPAVGAPASGSDSGGTGQLRSPSTPSTSRLVARIDMAGQAPSNCPARSATAEARCSQLSKTISTARSPTCSAIAATASRPGQSGTPVWRAIT